MDSNQDHNEKAIEIQRQRLELIQGIACELLTLMLPGESIRFQFNIKPRIISAHAKPTVHHLVISRPLSSMACAVNVELEEENGKR